MGNVVIGVNEVVNSILFKFGKLIKGFVKVEGYKIGLYFFCGYFVIVLE